MVAGAIHEAFFDGLKVKDTHHAGPRGRARNNAQGCGCGVSLFSGVAGFVSKTNAKYRTGVPARDVNGGVSKR